MPEFRMARVSELATTLLGADAKTIGEHFALMPLHTILELRKYLLETGQHALLVTGLLAGLNHPEPRVRYNCALAMDHVADDRCAEPLRALLEDAVPRVRRAALHSLSCEACKITHLPIPGDLIETLIAKANTNPSIRVRRAVVGSLIETCGQPRVLEALAELETRETDADIKRQLKRGLKRPLKTQTVAS
jgi:HEAT repeat protein